MKLYSYHGMDVPMDHILRDLDSEIHEDIPRERITVDGLEMIAIGPRMRLFWDAEYGVFAAKVRAVRLDDQDRECVSPDWTRADWLPHTSNAFYFAGNNGPMPSGFLATWSRLPVPVNFHKHVCRWRQCRRTANWLVSDSVTAYYLCDDHGGHAAARRITGHPVALIPISVTTCDGKDAGRPE